MNLDDQQFVSALRSALHYLYEPDQLRRSPLIALLGLSGRVDSTLALQQLLLDAIQALKPGDDAPPQANAWRLYDLLFFRYVRGYERLQVANQLGVSERQLAREQKNAIEALALHLLKTYPVDPSQASFPAAPPDPDPGRPGDEAGPWAGVLPTEKPAPWKPILLSVLDLLGSLARENEVEVACSLPEDLPDLLVPQVALRHSLLTILGWMIPQARQGTLAVTPALEGETLSLTAAALGRSFPGGPPDPQVEAARMLVERAGGSLELAAGAPASVRLAIPATAQVPVLVVDDNKDILQLFQRYVEGTRYAVTGLDEPGEALRAIEKINPRILLIDVMMPELDGWDLLTQLRTSRPLPGPAVLVCSILPQEGLARSLGADGFLQKPVLPQDFLDALDRQMERLSQEPDPP